MHKLKIATYQFNPKVGDIKNNTAKLIAAINNAKQNGANLFITSELALTGYSPEDLLFRPLFRKQVEQSLELFRSIYGITIVLGAPRYTQDSIFNSAYVYCDGSLLGIYDKHYLPNYGVFDEKRYFQAGQSNLIIECKQVKIGILICEDIWHDEPINQLNDANCIAVLNASPYHINKHQERINLLTNHVKRVNKPIIYVNQYGGQDDLVFDGASFAINNTTEIIQLSAFEESLNYLDYVDDHFTTSQIYSYPEELEATYTALVTAVRDYINKSGFKGALLGLSGGIDSALTLAILVDAIGANRVMAVMMPSQYTQDISVIDSRDMIKRLNVRYEEIAIKPIFDEFLSSLAPLFVDTKPDTTEENLQARTRGTLLMAISNKFGYLVVTTGNKSEMTTGYATLYGDMAGGFALLKDIPKTLVFKLSKWRNTLSEIIPTRIITRPPSAELRDNQVDQDSLPEYDVLDQIIDYLVIDKLSITDIIQLGFNEEEVRKVNRLLQINEYKRYQAAIGPKMTKCGYTRDWRYPITNGFVNE